MENNAFFAQIGLIMLIGLSGQERHPDRRVFARTRHEHGAPLLDAALEGAKIRAPGPILRPRSPLSSAARRPGSASGAGAVARKVMGTTVIGGMLAASALAIFLIPVTFYVIEMCGPRRASSTARGQAARPKPPGDGGHPKH